MRRAEYVRGSGTTEVVFSYTLVGGDGAHTTMGVSPDSLTLNGGTIRSVATSVDAALATQRRIRNGRFGAQPRRTDRTVRIALPEQTMTGRQRLPSSCISAQSPRG